MAFYEDVINAAEFLRGKTDTGRKPALSSAAAWMP